MAIGRREIIVGAAAAAACSRSTPAQHESEGRSPISATRLPTLYLPHGGGPWPWMKPGDFFEPRESAVLADYLARIPSLLPQKPKAMVVVSAHWEAPVPTVMTAARPPIYYDYYGFPADTYAITWPAPGAPDVAARVQALLGAANMKSAEDPKRGFDHGTFVPLKLTYPDADMPTIQLSLREGLDPAEHVAIGRALAPLRDEGILLVGSGMSYHNLRAFRTRSGATVASEFDAWLQSVVVGEPESRNAELVRWSTAPSARQAHPREEHLLPLMIIAGAAASDRGKVVFSDTFGGARISAVHFG